VKYWWPPKIGRGIGELLEQVKNIDGPNMIVLWGRGGLGELLEMLLSLN
jgi:hypothetical protein